MTIGEQIEKIKLETQILTALLANPHPGLSTWMKAVGRQLDNIAALAPSYRKVER